MEGLKRAAAGLRDKLTKSPLERLLAEATTNDNWGAPTTLLHQISEKTYSSSIDQDTVLRFFWDNLKAPAKEWRRLYKVLHLGEHLLRFGSTGCVRDLRDSAYKIRDLLDFSFNEDGVERGSGGNSHSVRDKAKSLLALIQNNAQLDEEREAARKQMGRYVGISSEEYQKGGRPNTGGKSYEGRGPTESNIVRGYDDDPRFRTSLGKETKPEPVSDMFKQTAAALEKPQPSKPVLATTVDTSVKPVAKPLAAPPNFVSPPKSTQVTEEFFPPPNPSPASAPINIFAPVAMTPVPPKPAPTENIFQPPAIQPAKPTPPPVQQTTPVQMPVFQPVQLPSYQQPGGTGYVQGVPQAPGSGAAPQMAVSGVTTPNVPVLSTPSSTMPMPPGGYPGYVAAPGYAPGLYAAPGPVPGYPPAGYPQYGGMPGYAAGPVPGYGAQPVPQKQKFHHNMDAYTGPSITQLKTTPGLKGEFTDFQSAGDSEPAKRSGDIESMLVNLDDLRVEAKTGKEKKKDNIGF